MEYISLRFKLRCSLTVWSLMLILLGFFYIFLVRQTDSSFQLSSVGRLSSLWQISLNAAILFQQKFLSSVMSYLCDLFISSIFSLKYDASIVQRSCESSMPIKSWEWMELIIDGALNLTVSQQFMLSVISLSELLKLISDNSNESFAFSSCKSLIFLDLAMSLCSSTSNQAWIEWMSCSSISMRDSFSYKSLAYLLLSYLNWRQSQSLSSYSYLRILQLRESSPQKYSNFYQMLSWSKSFSFSIYSSFQAMADMALSFKISRLCMRLAFSCSS